MAVYKFSSEVLKGVNKGGVLKPDADGYYDVILGALEFPNSRGDIYRAEQARQILNGDNIFTRRLRSSRLVGELGHPRRLPGQSEQEYVARIADIHEQNESHHIKEVIIDTTAKDKHGRPIIAFRGKVKPSGPYGHVLREKFNDPNQNVNFSIRSFTRDKYVNGRNEKYLIAIVTWDAVHEPGIDVADKFNSPSLESYALAEMNINPAIVTGAIEHQSGLGLESSSTAVFLNEVRASMENIEPEGLSSLKVKKHDWLNKW